MIQSAYEVFTQSLFVPILGSVLMGLMIQSSKEGYKVYIRWKENSVIGKG